MTHRRIRVLPDGTHVYANYNRYKPLAPEQRKYGVNKPDHPEAVRFHTRWFVPLELLPEDARVMPETRPDDDTLRHRAICRCQVCKRPQAPVLWRQRHEKQRSGLAFRELR